MVMMRMALIMKLRIIDIVRLKLRSSKLSEGKGCAILNIFILYLRNKDFGAVSQTEFARVIKFRVWCRLQNVIYIYYKILLTILSFAYGETLRKQPTFGDATTVFPAK